jgi:hypothetical protein
MFHASEAERPGFPALPIPFFVDLGGGVIVAVWDQGLASIS